MGIFSKCAMVYIETVDICSSQIKEGGMSKPDKYQDAAAVVQKMGDKCLTPAGDPKVQSQANNFDWWNLLEHLRNSQLYMML